jgi:hypothetical protein
VAGIAGLLVATGLIVYFGVDTIAQALLVVGQGLLWVSLFHLAPMTMAAISFRYLLPREGVPGAAAQLWIRWIRESINSLLPAGQVGGDLVSVRLLMHRAVNGNVAAAAVVADLTVGAATQGVFVIVGLITLVGYSAADRIGGLLPAVVTGFAIFGGAIGAFVTVQRKGLFRILARIAGAVAKGGKWDDLHLHAEQVDMTLREIYRDRGRLAASTVWRLAG